MDIGVEGDYTSAVNRKLKVRRQAAQPLLEILGEIYRQRGGLCPSRKVLTYAADNATQLQPTDMNICLGCLGSRVVYNTQF